MPSLFTYQDEDEDIETVNNNHMVVQIMNAKQLNQQRLSTRERIRKNHADKAKIIIDLRYCTACNIE
jgi:hypothetical protein